MYRKKIDTTKYAAWQFNGVDVPYFSTEKYLCVSSAGKVFNLESGDWIIIEVRHNCTANPFCLTDSEFKETFEEVKGDE